MCSEETVMSWFMCRLKVNSPIVHEPGNQEFWLALKEAVSLLRFIYWLDLFVLSIEKERKSVCNIELPLACLRLGWNNNAPSLLLVNTLGNGNHNLLLLLHVLGLYFLPLHAKITDSTGKSNEKSLFKLRSRQLMQMNSALRVSFKKPLL